MKNLLAVTSLLALSLGCTEHPPVPPVDARDVATDAVSDVAADTGAPDTGAPPDVAPPDAVDASNDVGDTGAATDATDDLGADAGADAGADTSVTDVAGDGAMAGAWMPLGTGSCNSRERQVPTIASPHVEPDAGTLTWLTNPPSSGPHYGTWARWGAHPELPRGYWVHNLEHGGVVYLYQCPSGTCAPVRDALVAASAMIPMDPACMPTDAEPARVRTIITRDNEIETPVAAAAWGWVFAADCVDPVAVREFYTRHAGMAPENFCADGFYP